MTKGPGRSDCYRVGVTYGYRECLRKGRVRASKKAAPQVRRPSVVRRICAELSIDQNIDPERSAHPFYRRHCARKHYAVFHGDRISTKRPFKQWDF